MLEIEKYLLNASSIDSANKLLTVGETSLSIKKEGVFTKSGKKIFLFRYNPTIKSNMLHPIVIEANNTMVESLRVIAKGPDNYAKVKTVYEIGCLIDISDSDIRVIPAEGHEVMIYNTGCEACWNIASSRRADGANLIWTEYGKVLVSQLVKNIICKASKEKSFTEIMKNIDPRLCITLKFNVIDGAGYIYVTNVIDLEQNTDSIELLRKISNILNLQSVPLLRASSGADLEEKLYQSNKMFNKIIISDSKGKSIVVQSDISSILISKYTDNNSISNKTIIRLRHELRDGEILSAVLKRFPRNKERILSMLATTAVTEAKLSNILAKNRNVTSERAFAKSISQYSAPMRDILFRLRKKKSWILTNRVCNEFVDAGSRILSLNNKQEI